MLKSVFSSAIMASCCVLGACGSNSNGDQSSSPPSSVTTSSSSSSFSSTSSESSSSVSSNASVFPASVTHPKIMIVGDSISAGPGCYKKYLNQNLQDNGYSDYEFVGEYTDDCGGGIRHSAVSCSTAVNYTNTSFTLPNCFAGQTFMGVSQLMPKHDPDLVMMQLGVNDIWGGNTPVQNVLNSYTTLVEQMRAHNPYVVIAVAQIHKIITDNCSNQQAYQNAQNLVNAVPAWAQQLSTDNSPIFVADLWTNSDANDASDCVHPNDTGAQKMGLNWFAALKDILPR